MTVLGWARVAVKLRRVDLSIFTTDELGPGDTFGEECMLDERRLRKTHNYNLNNVTTNGVDRREAEGKGGCGTSPVVAEEACGGGRLNTGGDGKTVNAAVIAAAGRSFETYQTLEVRVLGGGAFCRQGKGGEVTLGAGATHHRTCSTAGHLISLERGSVLFDVVNQRIVCSLRAIHPVGTLGCVWKKAEAIDKFGGEKNTVQ